MCILIWILKFTTLITAGLALVLLVLKNTLLDFSGAADDRYIEAYGPNFLSALKADRISFFTSDTMRMLMSESLQCFCGFHNCVLIPSSSR